MKLKKFVVNSGGKFNPDTTGPVVIDFSQSKMVGLTGDEGEGKSTILELFKMAAGQNGGEKIIEALKNKDNSAIDLELDFVGNDKADYQIKIKDGNITVRKEGEIKRSGEVSLLKDQLGIIGTSPLPFKNGVVGELVKWIAPFSKLGADEFEAQMAKCKKDQKGAKDARAAANKEAKGLRQQLVAEGYMTSKGEVIEKAWTASETKYKKKVDIKEVSARLETAGKDSDKYIRAEEKVKQSRLKKIEQERNIAELKEELKLAEAGLVETDKVIKAGEKYLTDNKDDKTNYDKVKTEFENVSKDAVAYDKWQDIKKKKTELDNYETASQKADALEKSIIKKQQELQWEVIPDIPGLEIILEDTHEDEGVQKKAGFYINGFSSAQMSNTEFFTAVFKILKKNKVPVVIVDDASQFGSSLMKTLEDLVKGGCYVLYTEMRRGQQSLEIQYK